ncbi:Retrovirus-related Pol polyprotein from transposon TNT 1-94 [Gossypium australe]|uniref:Retrovirus-related Pol polyprotein from transposon TNT 1-94 n=1 Tax=Gossypium australe TaxID=47621 RepID=A0A5B6V9F5_9ROSI|nr:Retrovirus-related Pol polyprotein from transposon TNT 1-94 [Gossypium australe]
MGIMLKRSKCSQLHVLYQEVVTKGWLIDSGCTNHMTLDESIFKNIDRNCILKVWFGNDKLNQAKGKGDVLINMASDIGCTIFDSLRQEVVIVSMKDKSFVLDWNLINLNAYTSSIDETNL